MSCSTSSSPPNTPLTPNATRASSKLQYSDASACGIVPSAAQPLSLTVLSLRRYDKAALDSVSDAARGLVFGLLELDPSRRLTASQALQHSFILQLSSAMKPSPRRSSVLDKLKRTVTVIRGYQVRVPLPMVTLSNRDSAFFFF